jgi:hypothetical protein
VAKNIKKRPPLSKVAVLRFIVPTVICILVIVFAVTSSMHRLMETGMKFPPYSGEIPIGGIGQILTAYWYVHFFWIGPPRCKKKKEKTLVRHNTFFRRARSASRRLLERRIFKQKMKNINVLRKVKPVVMVPVQKTFSKSSKSFASEAGQTIWIPH